MTRTKKRVEVRFSPDDNGMWLVEVIDEPRIHSHGRTIERADFNIREALALWHGETEDDFTVVPRYDLPKRLLQLVEQASELRQAARDLEEDLQRKTERAAKELSARGVSRRDAATLLGLSHQRVQQLIERRVS